MKASSRIRAARSAKAGFTMVEIAMAVAVIAFALVAIVGLLPLGMETQRDNREETIVNHDGTYLLDAIRGGGQYIDELTNFVDMVFIDKKAVAITSGADVIRALSSVNTTNSVVMRAISGAASVRSPDAKDFAMRYEVRSTVQPVSTLGSVDPVEYGTNFVESLYEVRLALFWPVTPTGATADNARRQVFRTMVSGSVDTNGFLNTSVFERK